MHSLYLSNHYLPSPQQNGSVSETIIINSLKVNNGIFANWQNASHLFTIFAASMFRLKTYLPHIYSALFPKNCLILPPYVFLPERHAAPHYLKKMPHFNTAFAMNWRPLIDMRTVPHIYHSNFEINTSCILHVRWVTSRNIILVKIEANDQANERHIILEIYSKGGMGVCQHDYEITVDQIQFHLRKPTF